MIYWGPKKTNSKKNSSSNDDDDDEVDLDVTVTENHIYFHTDVTGKSVKQLITAIQKLNKPGKLYREIWVHINCWGGTVYDALAAVDVMVASPTPIVTIIEGMAASAATMLSIAGDRRLIRPSGVMLIHQLRGGEYGKKCDVEDEMENLEKLEDRLVEYYVSNTKIRESKFRKMMGRELEYSAETCLKLGLVDEIYKGEEILGKRKRKR